MIRSSFCSVRHDEDDGHYVKTPSASAASAKAAKLQSEQLTSSSNERLSRSFFECTRAVRREAGIICFNVNCRVLWPVQPRCTLRSGEPLGPGFHCGRRGRYLRPHTQH